MKGNYIAPFYEGPAFNCANCQVYTKQRWFYMLSSENADGFGEYKEDRDFRVSYCDHCGIPTIWFNRSIVFPTNLTAEPPNMDLPEDIINDYNEARSIFEASPRGAAALLRLSIQKLCKHLGQPGNNINSDIKALVAKGLPNKVQEALDSVRVIGNDAVHPGELDLNDNKEIARKLFRLVNFIANKMITEPKEIDDIYGNLPPNKLKGIEERDKS